MSQIEATKHETAPTVGTKLLKPLDCLSESMPKTSNKILAIRYSQAVGKKAIGSPLKERASYLYRVAEARN